MPITVPQKSRRLAALSILFLRLAVDAQPRMRQRVEPVEPDLFAALLALAEFFGILVQTAQRLVHVPEVAPFLRREQERLLALHGVGALVGHVEGVARQIAVGALETRVEGLVVVPELLHHPGPFLEEPLFEVRELLLVQSALGLGAGLRRHVIAYPFVLRGVARRESPRVRRCRRPSAHPLPAADRARASWPASPRR